MAFPLNCDVPVAPVDTTAESSTAATRDTCWPLAVVLRKRRVGSGAWEADSWSVASVDSDRGRPSRELDCERLEAVPGTELYRWRGLELRLFRDERAAYRFNLGAATPRLFVNCNADDGGRMVPKLITASQDDAAAYMDGGEEDVFSIEMPAAIQCWIEAFLARCGEPEVLLGKGRHRQHGTPRERSGKHG